MPGRRAEEIRALAAACQARDYDEEAIPMFLVLEDVSAAGPPVPPSAEDVRLTRLAEEYLAALAADPERPTVVELSLALEVLGAHHFAPDAPGPSSDGGTDPAP
jgi:hypothetical protein